MNPDKKIKIAFIDDEQSVLNSIKRLFYKDNYEVFITSNAFDLYEHVKSLDVAVVISDQSMPHEKGHEVLHVVKQLSPNTTTILLTGYSDLTSVIKAVNDGNIFRCMTKPWKEDELRRSIWQGVEQYLLKSQNEELLKITQCQNSELKELNLSLEQKVLKRTNEVVKLNTKLQESFMETIKMIGAISELGGTSLAGHSKRVAKFAASITREMNLPEKQQFQIQIAAFLHDIGKISSGGLNKTKEEREEHVKLGFKIVSLVPALKEAAIVIKHHHEVYDGTGFPDKLSGEAIPLGARIIAVADAYDKSLNLIKGHETKTPQVLVQELKNLAGFKYDPLVVKAFISYLEKEKLIHNKIDEKLINLYELRSGMILSKPLKHQNGKMILNKDYEITEDMIDRIYKKHMEEPVETEVTIYARSA